MSRRVDTAAPELQLTECTVAQYYDISPKADRGDIFLQSKIILSHTPNGKWNCMQCNVTGNH